MRTAGKTYRCFTRENMMAVLKNVEAVFRRGPGSDGKPFTSHAVRGVFRKEATDAEGKLLHTYEGVVPERFRPWEEWRACYTVSTEAPTIAITYTWAMDLSKDLPAFLDEAEKVLRLTDEEKKTATWFLDCLVNDQVNAVFLLVALVIKRTDRVHRPDTGR